MVLSDIVFAKLRKIRLMQERKKLRNTDCTIISDNCLAGMLYHDYGMRFNSPTINTFIHAYDYNRFLEYIINKQDISNVTQMPSSPGECPKGLINGDVRIDFTHYRTFEEGAAKWKERAARINYDNLFVIMTEKSCRKDLVDKFNSLRFKHKLALVHREYPDLECAKVVKGFEREEKLGYIFGKYNYWGMNYYDQIDWVSFFNS